MCLSVLPCNLQRPSLSVAQVHKHLQSTKAILYKYKTKTGPMLGSELTGSDASFAGSCASLLDELVSVLGKHLGDVNHAGTSASHQNH